MTEKFHTNRYYGLQSNDKHSVKHVSIEMYLLSILDMISLK